MKAMHMGVGKHWLFQGRLADIITEQFNKPDNIFLTKTFPKLAKLREIIHFLVFHFHLQPRGFMETQNLQEILNIHFSDD